MSYFGLAHRHGAALLACSLFGACFGATQVTHTNTPPRTLAPRPPAEVHIFTTAPPTVPYLEVAIIESNLGASEVPKHIAALRDEAARIGCDGVVINNRNSDNDPSRGYWGACIVYTDTADPGATARRESIPVPPATAPPASTTDAEAEEDQDERPTTVP
jgi:hypothetical protein